MIRIRRSAERGHFNHGWLDTYHTFSFADYHDPAHMSFRALRVMNEDRVDPGQGFGMHPHRDMEIVTYVLQGQLRHQDSLGNGAMINAGELQRMTAGSGILHSEHNPSPHEPVHLYQIWLLPDQKGLPPGYEQKRITDAPTGQFQLVASPGGEDGALTIHQDARLYRAGLTAGQELRQPLAAGRHAWLQVLRGRLNLNDVDLSAGDGAAVSAETDLRLRAQEDSEVLLFDLA